MGEYVGKRRVRMLGIVVQVVPGQKIVWQLRKGVRLPVWLTLELADRDGGVDVRHMITAGVCGIGQVLDLRLRRYFSAKFAAAMKGHARTELPLLRDHLVETHRTSLSGSATASAIFSRWFDLKSTRWGEYPCRLPVEGDGPNLGVLARIDV
jgi:hypothetical protein